MLRELTAGEVEFVTVCHPEDVPIEGNASAWDDEKANRRLVKWIEKQLDNGNQWAWCCVEVVAKWRTWKGRDTLGCCSYKGEKDFCRNDGYWPDMKAEALERLNAALAEADADLEELRELHV